MSEGPGCPSHFEGNSRVLPEMPDRGRQPATVSSGRVTGTLIAADVGTKVQAPWCARVETGRPRDIAFPETKHVMKVPSARSPLSNPVHWTFTATRNFTGMDPQASKLSSTSGGAFLASRRPAHNRRNSGLIFSDGG